MRKLILFVILSFFMFSFVGAAGNDEPMILRSIKEIVSVDPADVANLGFGVFEVSAQYNLGAYHSGDWYGEENRNIKDSKSGAFWVEFSWDRPETNVILKDGLGNIRKIYLPASTPSGNSTYGEYYWISEDGSSYYATSNHSHGWPDLSYGEALVPEHLARNSLSPDQRNPEEEEPEPTGIGESGATRKIVGRLIDEMTMKPIKDAKLYSAYEFSPEEVTSDSDGNFEFVVSSDYDGSWNFMGECYGWADGIGLQKDYEVWKNGQRDKSYEWALRKSRFDAEEDVSDASGKNVIDAGNVYAWPSADISIESDIEASFNVMYKYKNSEGYNGGGNSNFRREHYSSSALPLDYDVFIQFEDESGREYKSTTYHTPKEAWCGVVTLRYFNGESEWNFLSIVEPDGESGPIEIDVPEVIIEEGNDDIVSRICSGCLLDKTCYPMMYRKDNNYCSESLEWMIQKSGEESCENNFECDSNVCVDDKCVSAGLMRRILNWFKRLFG